MKSTYIIKNITLLLLGVLVFASCRGIRGNGDVTSQERSVGNFTKVESDGAFQVYIKKGSENKVIVTTDENLQRFIETEVDNGKLVIKVKNNTWIRKSEKMEVLVITTSLESIQLKGSGKMEMQSKFEADYFNCDLDGSGNMSVWVESDHCQTTLDGSGLITVKGSGENFDGDIDGSGNIEAFSFSSEKATAEIDGSGLIQVKASDYLYAKVNGSGTILYDGNPTVEAHVNGSGHVNHR